MVRLSIIDYLVASANIWQMQGILANIRAKLGRGIVVIVLQKNRNSYTDKK